MVESASRGFWNLPGGGVDGNEDPTIALYRELREELGITTEHIHNLRVNSMFTERIPNSNVLAHWMVYAAKLLVPHQELVPDRTEITRAESMPLHLARELRPPVISALAKRALGHTHTNW